MAKAKIATRTTKAKPAVIGNCADLDAEIAADAANEAPTRDMLSLITATAHQMKQHQGKAEKLTEEAAVEQKEARRLAEQVLPPLMDEAGVTDVGLDDDTMITRAEEYYASISQENQSEASAWLDKNGYGSLLKMAIIIPVDKGDTRATKTICALLKKARVGFAVKSSVHGATLKAFVKESLTMNPPRALPDAITHHVQPVVVLKAKKKPAAARRASALV